jgi:hypothetical protein
MSRKGARGTKEKTYLWPDEQSSQARSSTQSHYSTCKHYYYLNGLSKQSPKSQEDFYWYGTKDTYNGGHSLVAWPKVTLSKTNGQLKKRAKLKAHQTTLTDIQFDFSK